MVSDPSRVLDDALLALARGEPELVMVDRRVLRVLLGPLADLLVQIPTNYGGDFGADDDGPYVWDRDELCP